MRMWKILTLVVVLVATVLICLLRTNEIPRSSDVPSSFDRRSSADDAPNDIVSEGGGGSAESRPRNVDGISKYPVVINVVSALGGAPVIGAAVSASSGDWESERETDVDGRVTFELSFHGNGASERTLALEVKAWGFSRATESVDLGPEPFETVTVEMMRLPFNIDGNEVGNADSVAYVVTVSDKGDGGAIADALVACELGGWSGAGVTDEKGVVAFPLDPGLVGQGEVLYLTVEHDSYETERWSQPIDDIREYLSSFVRMKPYSSVTLRVFVTDHDGSPIKGANVCALRLQDESSDDLGVRNFVRLKSILTPGSQRTDTLGRAELHLEPGNYIVKATHPDLFAHDSVRLSVLANEFEELKFEVGGPSSAEIVVEMEQTGESVHGARVTLSNETCLAEAKTDTDGLVEFRGVLPGEYAIRVAYSGGHAINRRLTIRDGAPARMTIGVAP